MKHYVNEDSIELFTGPRLTSDNAESFYRDAVELIRGCGMDDISVDADELIEIDDSGTDIIKRLAGSFPGLSVVNAQNAIYDILKTCGITEMIPVYRSLRHIDAERCAVIAPGSIGRIYRLDEDTVLKVFRYRSSFDTIRKRHALAEKAFALGIPTAKPYDIVRIGDGYGAVFGFLNGVKLSEVIASDIGGLDMYIDMYVDLIRKIHSTYAAPGEMPSIKTAALGWADCVENVVSPTVYDKLCSMIEDIPDTGNMLHGDCHIKNIMVENGRLMLIDMDTICIGHPIFEFAALYQAYIGFNELYPGKNEAFFGLPDSVCSYIMTETVKRCFPDGSDRFRADVIEKARLLCMLRLLRRTALYGADIGNTKNMIGYCRDILSALVEKTDTLYC